MARISVNITAVRAANALLRSVEGRGTGIRGFFAGIRNAIDSRILGRRGIAAKHATIMAEIKLLQEQLERLRVFVDDSMTHYANTDTNLSGMSSRNASANRSGSDFSVEGENAILDFNLDHTAYMGAFKTWLVEELGLNDFGELELIFLIAALYFGPNNDWRTRREVESLKVALDLRFEGGSEAALSWALENHARINRLLRDELKSGGVSCPNQREAIRQLIIKFEAPDLSHGRKRTAIRIARMNLIRSVGTSIVLGVFSFGIGKIKGLPAVVYNLNRAFSTMSKVKDFSKVMSRLAEMSPSNLRRARTHFQAELSWNRTLYNRLPINYQGSDASVILQRKAINTLALLCIEIQEEHNNIRAIERQSGVGNRDLFGSPTPPWVEREINERRQRIEELEQHRGKLDNISQQTLTTQRNIINNAISVLI